MNKAKVHFKERIRMLHKTSMLPPENQIVQQTGHDRTWLAKFKSYKRKLLVNATAVDMYIVIKYGTSNALKHSPLTKLIAMIAKHWARNSTLVVHLKITHELQKDQKQNQHIALYTPKYKRDTKPLSDICGWWDKHSRTHKENKDHAAYTSSQPRRYAKETYNLRPLAGRNGHLASLLHQSLHHATTLSLNNLGN